MMQSLRTAHKHQPIQSRRSDLTAASADSGADFLDRRRGRRHAVEQRDRRTMAGSRDDVLFVPLDIVNSGFNSHLIHLSRRES